MTKSNPHYHLQYFEPFKNDYVEWPVGGWSVFNLDGDQIAMRTGFDANGYVTRRDSWPGYLGISETLEGVAAIIREDMEKE